MLLGLIIFHATDVYVFSEVQKKTSGVKWVKASKYKSIFTNLSDQCDKEVVAVLKKLSMGATYSTIFQVNEIKKNDR